MEHTNYVKVDNLRLKREKEKKMNYKEFIDQCLWSLEDYRRVQEFIFRVKEYIHLYGAYTLDDLKNEILFVSVSFSNDEFSHRSHADCNKGWIDATGFDFEIVGKHLFKVIIPWENFYEDLTEPLAIKDHQTAVECGTFKE